MAAERLTFGTPTPLGGQMDCMVLTTPRQVLDMVRDLEPTTVHLDTETDGLNPRKNRLVAIQILQEEGLAYILDWRRLAGMPGVPETLSDFLQETLAVAHNLKFDLNFLYYAGIELGRVWDTKTAQQVLDGQGAQEGASFALKDVAPIYHPKLDMSKAEREWFYKDLPKSPADWLAPFPKEEVRYMGLDVEVLPGIYNGQQAAFLEKPSLVPVMELEMRVLPALAAMERQGIRVDTARWRGVIADKGVEAKGLEGALLEFVAEPILRVRLEQYDRERGKLNEWEAAKDAEEAECRAAYDAGTAPNETWGEFKQAWMHEWRSENPRPTSPKQDTSLPNVGSSQQLMDAFGVLNIPAPSTDAKKLAPLEADYPAVKALVRFRKAQKFVDAFGESLLSLVEDDEEGNEVIHPDYNAIGAATGRMSCRHPNWQQVPARGDGRRLRECVIARPDCSLVVADFSNIELRILAAYSKDPNLIAMLTGSDMHSEMAYRMFKLGREVNVKEASFPPSPGWTYRDVAKKINYGLVYGMSSIRLSSELRIGKTEAQELMDAYFEQLPKVRGWLARAGEVGMKEHYARTKLGRVRRLAPEQGAGRMRRQAMNTPIQGTSADITKLAVANYYEDERRQGQLVAVVHDELVAETYTFRAGDEMTWLEDAMDKAQQELLGKSLPSEALPRPMAVVSDHWEH